MRRPKKTNKGDFLLYNDHKLPSNRRDFLASGMIGLSTSVFLPSLTTMMMQSPAYAQSMGCSELASSCGVPYICIEGAGGMNIAGGNVMVGFERGGDQTDVDGPGTTAGDFIRLGIPASQHPSKTASQMMDNSYGLVFHRNSGILAGMNSVLNGVLVNGKDIKTMIDGLIICTRTGDDTNSNPTNTVYMAQKCGAEGQLVQLIGDSNTDSGARSAAPSSQIDLTKRPSQIRSFTDSEGLLSIGDAIMGNGSLNASAGDAGTARMQEFLKRVSGMSKSRLEEFKRQPASVQMAVGLEGALDGTSNLFNKFSPVALNPANAANNSGDLAILQQAFGGTGNNVDDQRVASVGNLVLNRIAGAGSVTVGGCDYHNGSAATGERKDEEIGRYIGKLIRLASLKGQNLFLHLYTDGGVTGDSGGLTDDTPEGKGKVVWTSDSGTRSAAVLIIYKHDSDGSSLIRDNETRQIGNYIKGGGADLAATSASNNMDNLWKAIILNYLATMDTTGDKAAIINKFESIFGRGSAPNGASDFIRFKSLVA